MHEFIKGENTDCHGTDASRNTETNRQREEDPERNPPPYDSFGRS